MVTRCDSAIPLLTYRCHQPEGSLLHDRVFCLVRSVCRYNFLTGLPGWG